MKKTYTTEFRPLEILIILIFGLFMSCKKEDDSDLVCTSEFKIITVSIIDVNSDKIILDKFSVIDKNSGLDVTPPESLYPLNFAQERGEYPIVTDGSIELNSTREMTFIGYINNQEVIRSEYVAEEKLCGVSLISGNLTLITE